MFVGVHRARSVSTRHPILHGSPLTACGLRLTERPFRDTLSLVKCPFCAAVDDRVVDSRESREGEVIRRRRECTACGRRFTSYETIEEIPYMVVKNDGRRERFDRNKLRAGLVKACEKRPVTPIELDR